MRVSAKVHGEYTSVCAIQNLCIHIACGWSRLQGSEGKNTQSMYEFVSRYFAYKYSILKLVEVCLTTLHMHGIALRVYRYTNVGWMTPRKQY